MSTHSLINVKCEDGKVRSIYVHYDGYGHLPILLKGYNNQRAAEELVAHGNASTLYEDIDRCAFYKGKNEECRTFNSFEEAAEQDLCQEYIYQWDGEWRMIDLRLEEYKRTTTGRENKEEFKKDNLLKIRMVELENINCIVSFDDVKRIRIEKVPNEGVYYVLETLAGDTRTFLYEDWELVISKKGEKDAEQN